MGLHSVHRFIQVSLLALVLPVMTLSSEGLSDSSSPAVPMSTVPPVSIVDFHGRTVGLAAPARTVVSLSPGITETVFALGYGDRLVGRTSYCNHPPEALSVPVTGNLMEPDIEAILSADPDIVIASTHFPPEALAALERVGLNVAVFLGQESFDGAYDGVIRPVAALLGDTNAGERLVGTMERRRREAMSTASGFPRRPTVYYVVGFGEGGDWTAGGDTFIHEMITAAGGENIAADVTGWSFSLETLVERNPEIILIPPWADGIFTDTPVYSDLDAVRSGHVFVIDEDAIVRQGPRLADGLAHLVEAVGSVFR